MNLDGYEYVGLMVPGSVVTFVMTLLSPDIRDLVAKEGFDLGGFGVFVLVSLVVGFLVQAIGNWIEAVEKGLGTAPSERLRRGEGGIVSEEQFVRMRACLLSAGAGDPTEMTPKAWRSTQAEMAATIRAQGGSHRLDLFVRMYGLGRGLTSAFLLAICLTLLFPEAGAIRWRYILILAIGLILSFARTRQFSEHYLRELVIGYLRTRSV